MTYKEKWEQENPGKEFKPYKQCVVLLGYEKESEDRRYCPHIGMSCSECWDREIPEEKPVFEYQGEPIAKVRDIKEENGVVTVTLENPGNGWAVGTIKDSGDRTEFATGAVRDMREGKGRCDLMPLEVVANVLPRHDAEDIINKIRDFQKYNDTGFLYSCLDHFARRYSTDSFLSDTCTMFLEVAKHFEEGAKKYGENNWQKGIPVHCYIDSAIRHYLKWLRGDKDEPHDRAFVWNIMCCIWEVDYHKEEK